EAPRDVPLAQPQEKRRIVPAHLGGDAYGRHVRDRRVAAHGPFNLLRADAVPAHVEHLVVAPKEGQRTVRIRHGGVAGVVPAGDVGVVDLAEARVGAPIADAAGAWRRRVGPPRTRLSSRGPRPGAPGAAGIGPD